MMTLENLLEIVSRPDSPNLCVDSRLAKSGDIFIAVKGAHLDGHNFIGQAVANGAKFIVAQKNLFKGLAPPSAGRGRSSGPFIGTQYELILVDNSAKAAAKLAHAKKGFPANKLTCLAVTGTNGKTTVAYLVRSIIQSTGRRCGLIGTVQYDTGEKTYQSKLTTPDPFTIADITSQMVAAGAKFMITEASSHALDQDRLAGVNFTAAAFTNLTGDHLDYHKTKDNYLAAKTRLFQSLSADATAVLNRQSPESAQIAAQTKARILWYSIDEPADPSSVAQAKEELTAHIQVMNSTGTSFALEYNPVRRSLPVLRSESEGGSEGGGQKHFVKTPLLGRFNVSNCLAAAGLCIAAGFDLDTICAALSNPDKVPGRLEKVNCPGHESPDTAHVLIDYAHTDDALKNVLETLEPLCAGKLIVVFGCGGDRDRTKRPRMAKVAEKFADLIIVTSDNPRTENPQAIINEIVAGFETGPAIPYSQLRVTGHGARVTKIIEPDRKTAIGIAIEKAQDKDIILIAGKGHENYQILADKTIHFSDQEVATEFLQKKVVSLPNQK
jgi:UDP-N-acetylmuramoyl-L-alanyl-D-glutamate--2,6-diaminopimelate ligase